MRDALFNVRETTAMTVNEELHSLQHSCRRIAKRLRAARDAGDTVKRDQLQLLLNRQAAELDKAIKAALAGNVYRHRSRLDHMNEGIDNAKVAGHFESAVNKAIRVDAKVRLIPSDVD